MTKSQNNPSRQASAHRSTRSKSKLNPLIAPHHGPGDDTRKGGVTPPKQNSGFKFTHVYGSRPGDDTRKIGGVTPPRSGEQNAQIMERRKIRRSKRSQYKTYEELVELLQNKLGALWLQDAPRAIFIGDSEYYCPPLDEAAGIIRRAPLKSASYQAEIFDCDDYACSLKGHFVNNAFHNGYERPFAYAFGTIWLEKPFSHALNWIVAWPHRNRAGTTVYLVEPQTGLIYDIDGSGQLRPINPETGEIGAPVGNPYCDIYFLSI